MRRQPDWRNHFVGVWALCALDAGSLETASRALALLTPSSPGSDDWRSLGDWIAWFAATAPTTLPKWTVFGVEILRERAAARAALDPSAPWVRAWILRAPDEWDWQSADTDRTLAGLSERELAELAERLQRAGMRHETWRVWRLRWARLGMADPIDEIDRWHPEGGAAGLIELARLAFFVRDWPKAAAAGRAAWLGGEHEGLLWWGRATARQGRVAEAGEIWAKHVDRVRGGWLEAAVAYRLGVIAEELGRPGEALRWYDRAAAVPVEHDDREEAGFRAGWLRWKAGDVEAARTAWQAEMARSLSIVGLRRVRYWAARAAGGPAAPEARAIADALLQESPLSYYAWRWNYRAGSAPTVIWTTADAVRAPASLEMARRAFAWGLEEPGVRMLAEAWRSAAHPGEAVAVLAVAQEVGRIDDSFRWFWSRFESGLREAAPMLDRPLWEILHPRPWRPLVEREAARRGLDPLLVWSVMREESRFSPAVESPVGALGLLQIMPATGQMLARRHGVLYTGAHDLKDPEVNITLGVAYIADLLQQYDGRLHFAIAAYNAGPNAVDRWRAGGVDDIDAWAEDIPYAETRNYVRKVLRSYIRYRALYAPAQGVPGDVAALPAR